MNNILKGIIVNKYHEENDIKAIATELHMEQAAIRFYLRSAGEEIEMPKLKLDGLIGDGRGC
ncbi:hypothetical protein LABALGNA3A7_09580 [Dellaglioa algida]|nr:hypothetical protein LABALGNA3A7_09580 [Dellaglioa algida]